MARERKLPPPIPGHAGAQTPATTAAVLSVARAPRAALLGADDDSADGAPTAVFTRPPMAQDSVRPVSLSEPPAHAPQSSFARHWADRRGVAAGAAAGARLATPRSTANTWVYVTGITAALLGVISFGVVTRTAPQKSAGAAIAPLVASAETPHAVLSPTLMAVVAPTTQTALAPVPAAVAPATAHETAAASPAVSAAQTVAKRSAPRWVPAAPKASAASQLEADSTTMTAPAARGSAAAAKPEASTFAIAAKPRASEVAKAEVAKAEVAKAEVPKAEPAPSYRPAAPPAGNDLVASQRAAAAAKKALGDSL
jgi:trimeric autotransporter adhesin